MGGSRQELAARGGSSCGPNERTRERERELTEREKKARRELELWLDRPGSVWLAKARARAQGEERDERYGGFGVYACTGERRKR